MARCYTLLQHSTSRKFRELSHRAAVDAAVVAVHRGPGVAATKRDPRALSTRKPRFEYDLYL